jgi:hypothetical protein
MDRVSVPNPLRNTRVPSADGVAVDEDLEPGTLFG